MRALAIAAIALSGCALNPALTEREDPKTVIREVFETRISQANAAIDDREVLAIDPIEIRYRERGQERALRFQDVAIVERAVPRDAERELENIRLYLKKGSPSIRSAAPTSSVLDFRQPHILLDRRPLGSLERLRGALEQMRERREPEPKTEPPAIKPSKPEPAATKPTEPSSPEKPAATKPTPTPAVTPTPKPAEPSKPTAAPPLDLKVLEDKLRVLKRWLAEGLIDQEEYEAKKRELLEKM